MQVKIKTKEHILALLKSVAPFEEMDKLLIEQFCRQLYSNIKIAWGDNQSSVEITYQKFVHWMYLNSPNIGDVIVYDSEYTCDIVIVKLVGLDQIISGVVVDNKSNLSTMDVFFPLLGYRQPSESERSLIFRKLSDNGLEWSFKYNKVIEKFRPASGSYVKIVFSDNSNGVGVFDRIDNEGFVFMHCIKTDDGIIQFGIPESIGLFSDIHFYVLSDIDKKILQVSLSDVGKCWNAHLKRIEPLNMRSEKGYKYYFINDRMAISEVIESQSVLDSKRYAGGNYFRSQIDAKKALARIKTSLRDYHAEPLIGNDDA